MAPCEGPNQLGVLFQSADFQCPASRIYFLQTTAAFDGAHRRTCSASSGRTPSQRARATPPFDARARALSNALLRSRIAWDLTRAAVRSNDERGRRRARRPVQPRAHGDEHSSCCCARARARTRIRTRIRIRACLRARLRARRRSNDGRVARIAAGLRLQQVPRPGTPHPRLPGAAAVGQAHTHTHTRACVTRTVPERTGKG